MKKKPGKAVASNGFWVSEINLDIFLFSDGHLFLRISYTPLNQLGTNLMKLKFYSLYINPVRNTPAAQAINPQCR